MMMKTIMIAKTCERDQAREILSLYLFCTGRKRKGSKREEKIGNLQRFPAKLSNIRHEIRTGVFCWIHAELPTPYKKLTQKKNP